MTVRHLLVTNDFPPKIGGIQSYLWELWRRLPPGAATVLTTPHPDAERWDKQQSFPIHRVREPVLLPHRRTVRRIRDLAAATKAEIIVLDPALPLGLVGPCLGLPYAVVLHGAEVAVPGRLPITRRLLGSVVGSARLVIAAGRFPAEEAARACRGSVPPQIIIPPGVDTDRFRPLDAAARTAARVALGLPSDGRLVVSVSRLVPRKGMDTLIDVAAMLAPSHTDLVVAIAGAGRDRRRLQHRIDATGAPAGLLGRVDDEALAQLCGAGDVFAMLCRNRWGGLEQEGFGIVFLEAAACGVPQVAGASGGAAEAVEDGVTGFVVEAPHDPTAAARVLARLLDDPGLRARQGAAARRRAVESFSYDALARELANALIGAVTPWG